MSRSIEKAELLRPGAGGDPLAIGGQHGGTLVPRVELHDLEAVEA